MITDELIQWLRNGIDPHDIQNAEAAMDTAADELERLRKSPDSEPFDPFGVALILKDQTAELERLRQDCAWKACIIKACDTEMERLRGLLREAGIDPALSSESGE